VPYEMFEEYADRYDEWYTRHASILASELKAMRSLRLRGLGLDLGVGTGVFAGRLGVPVGVDPSARMLSIAKKRGVQTIQALGENLPFRSDSFDYALMINTLCFLDKPGVVLDECTRVLGKHGRLLVCDIVRDSEWGRLYERRGRAGHRLYSHAKFYTRDDLERMLRNHGFQVIELRATLKFGPKDPERVEAPSKDPEGRGFICLVARHSES